jgi:methylthioribose-1-phosphate isomerase
MDEGTKIMQPLWWLGHSLKVIDQTRLPGEETYLELHDLASVIAAIKQLRIRGAPTIGVAAAYGIVLGAREISSHSREEFQKGLDQIGQAMTGARPTAKNLFGAVDRMLQVKCNASEPAQIYKLLEEEATKIHAEEITATERLSRYGADLIGEGATILTHCNAGPLATTGYGTALGIIFAAQKQGKKVKVLACETRPLLQGARLTTWELRRGGVPVTLITDSMAGYFLHAGIVSCVLVGADRITANGDTANKIGTYSLAVLARENGVPFYVAAPTTTIDHSLSDGGAINIEQRAPEEVTHCQGIAIAPPGTPALNPAFDVTPHRYVSALITEKGVIREPDTDRLRALNI